MPTSAPNAAPTGFRWKWLPHLGAVVLLFAAARYFNVQELLKQTLDWVGRFLIGVTISVTRVARKAPAQQIAT